MEPLEDIITPAQNSALADQILEMVRSCVENPDFHLIASIAGGRKTMGALLYAAMTLLAREGDRITHVLVNPPYENLSGFFFPTQPGGLLAASDGTMHSPARASVLLADVPFVPLRNRFRELQQMPGTFQNLVRAFSREPERDPRALVAIDYAARRLSVNGHSFPCAASVLLLVHFLIEERSSSRPLLSQIDAGERYVAWRDAGNPRDVDPGLLPPPDRLAPAEFIRKKLSDLRRTLREAGVPWEVPLRDLSLRGAVLKT